MSNKETRSFQWIPNALCYDWHSHRRCHSCLVLFPLLLPDIYDFVRSALSQCKFQRHRTNQACHKSGGMPQNIRCQKAPQLGISFKNQDWLGNASCIYCCSGITPLVDHGYCINLQKTARIRCQPRNLDSGSRWLILAQDLVPYLVQDILL